MTHTELRRRLSVDTQWLTDYSGLCGEHTPTAASVCAWSVLTAPSTLFGVDDEPWAQGLMTLFDLDWYTPFCPGTPTVEGSVEAEGNRVVVKLAVSDAETVLATASLTFRTAGEPTSRPGHDGERFDHESMADVRRSNRTISEREVRDYIELIRSRSVSGRQYSWAELPPRPQSFVPSGLLTSEFLRAAGAPSTGSLRMWCHRPLLADAALEWETSTNEMETVTCVRGVGAAEPAAMGRVARHAA